MLRFAVALASLAALASGFEMTSECGASTTNWRVRSQVLNTNWGQTQAAFQDVHNASNADFTLQQDKNLVAGSLVINAATITLDEQSSSGGSWDLTLTSWTNAKVSGGGWNCYKGDRIALATPPGSATTYRMALKGYAYVAKEGSDIFLYFELADCQSAPDGTYTATPSAEQLDEMCNINVATHALTNVLRGACIIENNAAGNSIAGCAALEANPWV